MGAWGFKEIQSDNGLDRLHSSFYAGIEGTTLNVDKALKLSHEWIVKCGDEGKIARHPEDIKRYIAMSDKDDAIAMAELLHYFKNNIILNTFAYLEIDQETGWFTVQQVVVSRQTLQSIIKALDNHLNTDLKTFESSGWHEVEVYNQRVKWIAGISKELKALLNQPNNPIIVFDKQHTPPEVFMYRERVKFTENHDLNRLRLLIKNELQFDSFNNYIKEAIKTGEIKQPYLSADVYTARSSSYYRLVFHDIGGNQQTVFKSANIDEVVQYINSTVESIEESLRRQFCISGSRCILTIWNRLYNRGMYTRYYKQLHN